MNPNQLCDCGYSANENNICTGCGLPKPESAIIPKEISNNKLHTDKDMFDIIGAYLSAGCPNYPQDPRGSWIKWCEMYLSNKKLNN